ncbi:MAG: hypothetical protein ACYSWU_27020, partial [Planctomycetota bacterium]
MAETWAGEEQIPVSVLNRPFLGSAVA